MVAHCDTDWRVFGWAFRETRDRIVGICSVRGIMDPDRRRNVRFPFDASADLAEENTDKRMVAHVSELSLNGCFVQTANPFPNGTFVVVKIFTEGRFFEARATVASSQPKVGMRLAFRDVKPYFANVLKKWLLTAMAGRPRPPA